MIPLDRRLWLPRAEITRPGLPTGDDPAKPDSWIEQESHASPSANDEFFTQGDDGPQDQDRSDSQIAQVGQPERTRPEQSAQYQP
jgi:hypothetical protein